MLSYSHQHIGNSVQIVPHGLLTEEGIKHHSFEVVDWNGMPAFPLTYPNSQIPFDIFTASFYLVTRYEEYTVSKSSLDKHIRYKHQMSLAYNNNFLHLPVIDLWAYRLLDILKSHNYSLTVKPRRFNYITTVDLDSAYAFKHKGLLRVTFAAFKSLLSNGKPNFLQRFRVVLGLAPDPFDIYDDLIQILPESPQTVWFIHTGKWGKYDKSIPVNKPAVKTLINRLGEKFRIGIHPSYGSFLNEKKTRKEVSVLVDALNLYVACSRQHFLRLSLPKTYRMLIKLGITEDFTMGYSDVIGFRAGTCTPFVFFDLPAEQMLNLKVFPFQVMDSTFVGNNLAPSVARDEIFRMVDSVRSVNGTFISIWHIDYLSGYGYSKGWLSTIKEMLNYLREEQ